MLDKKTEKELLDIFGERVAFHDAERRLYSSDAGSPPGFVRKQIQADPDAVVQPDSQDELEALVDLAARCRTPLVPRGSGTAGYGGAVPSRGGIVVDMHRLGRIIDIDPGQYKVTVESGAVLADIENELRQHHLALRLYPSSAMSATPGGWLANGGGVGIGSYEYGRIRENVAEVNLVTPKGSRWLAGEDLDLVDGMAGTTGFISQLTLMVRPGDADVPVLGAFRRLEDLLGTLAEINRAGLALWHAGYQDPTHSRLSREAEEKQAGRSPGRGGRRRPGLPEDRILAIFIYPEDRRARVADRLLDIIRAHDGEVLDAVLAGFEWEERFYPMRLKALGPSLIQSEAIVPTGELPAVAANISRRIKGAAFTGTLLNNGAETAIIAYGLEDERRRGFTLAYPASLIAIEEARRHGGRAYATGMYLTTEAASVFGEAKLRQIYGFKKEVDPAAVMNPGKVFPAGLDKEPSTRKLSRLVRLGGRGGVTLKAIDRLFGGRSPGETIGSKTALAALPFAGRTAWDAFACVGCGYCRRECPQFKAIGWESASPRGKFHLLREYLKGNVALDERMAEMFFACTTCHQCDEICQVRSRIEEDWTWVAKPAVLKEGFRPPLVFQRQAHHVMVDHNPNGGPQDERMAWMTSDLKYREEGEIGYFAGCAVSYTYLLRNLPINAFRILNRAGIEPVYLGRAEWCCGGAMFNVGCIDELAEIVRHNLNEIARRGIRTLITSCSSCWYNLAMMYPVIARQLNLTDGLEVKHITEFVSNLIEEERIKCEKPVELEITYHDPCHIGRGGGIYEPPRKIMASIPGLKLTEMPRNREHSACCGKHIMRYPRLGHIINSGRTMEAAATGAAAVVCSCSTCENNLRQGVAEAGIPLEVIDIMDLVAESLGLPRVSVSKLPRLLRSRQREAGDGNISDR